MIDAVRHTFKGMNKDLSKEKYDPRFYYDAQNTLIANSRESSLFSASNAKGNSEIFQINTISLSGNNINYTYTLRGNSNNSTLSFTSLEIPLLSFVNNNHRIIHNESLEDRTILFVSNFDGLDSIWELKENEANLLYVRNLGFNENTEIQSLFNHENNNIQKLYWVDGVNQIRQINIADTDLINTSINVIDIRGQVELVLPEVIGTSRGGIHTSGVIQYAYSLFRINGGQTTISPLSEPISLSNERGGGDVNEIVSQINTISIDSIDQNYEGIRIYSIKYNTLGALPLVNLIFEGEINTPSLSFDDDGRSQSTLTVEEFLFLGGDPSVAGTITSKDNRLLVGNLQDTSFNVNFDTRAYGFDNRTSLSTYRLALQGDVNFAMNFTSAQAAIDYMLTIDDNYDCINPNFDFYNRNIFDNSIGGYGPYINYSIVKKTASQIPQHEDYKFFKSSEVYRLGIEFYNNLGQACLPKWIGDFRAPEGNLDGEFLTLTVRINSAGQNLLRQQGVVGWRILRAERRSGDKTILTQGIVQPTIYQEKNSVSGTYDDEDTNGQFDATSIKYPTPLLRDLRNYTESINRFDQNLTIRGVNNYANIILHRNFVAGHFPATELYGDRSQDGDFRRQQTFQNTRILQHYSPEVLFDENFSADSITRMRIIGSFRNQANSSTGRYIRIGDRESIAEYTRSDGISLYGSDNDGNFRLMSNGVIGGSGNSEGMNFYQFNRRLSDFEYSSVKPRFAFMSNPVIVSEGEEDITYANNSAYRFNNNLLRVISDLNSQDTGSSGDPGIVGVNTLGVRSIVMSENSGTTLEDLAGIASINRGFLVVELIRDLPNQYGGRTYEARKNTKYINIGSYNQLSAPTIDINSPGDVFVSNFRYLRMTRGNTEVLESTQMQYVEIVEHMVETTVDLKNRNDASLLSWDTNFQPNTDGYHKYNNVYSQEPNLIVKEDTSFTFERVSQFPNLIRASRPKIAGEIVDSWTDILPNESLNLDGKYGDLILLHSHHDNIYAFQAEAFASLSVNPRVQVVGDDGVSTELGTGNVLDRYTYLSTEAGINNKKAVFSSISAIYFLDAKNRSINKFFSNTLQGISNIYGIDSYMYENVAPSDNAIGYYDVKNDLCYFTVLDKFTVSFNEKLDVFTSFWSFIPKLYIKYLSELVTTDDNSRLWQHYIGDYDNYYGSVRPMSVTLLTKPQSNNNIFNNLEFRSECLLGTDDQTRETINIIKSWNNYQVSNAVNLVWGNNIRRRDRTWRLLIPRDRDRRLNRIRGPWIFNELTYNNQGDRKFILHDVTTYFNRY